MKMKRNKLMRVASGLLVATLLSTCVISGTFAKYTAGVSSNDTATVAKWGISVSADDTKSTFDKVYKNGENTVVSSASESVAPGTSGQVAPITVAGTSEVKVGISYAATVDLTGWTVDGAEYCPLIITVAGVDYKMGATASASNHVYSTVATFKAAVEAAIANNSATYAPGTPLSGVTTPTISWRWDFEGAEGGYQTDAKDTALGSASTLPTVEITVATTVSQLQ
jgi:hypothetical protein